MTALPEPTVTLSRLIDAAQQQSPPRPHMGCSMLGHPCDRYLWLSFRWAVIDQFPGRILRLFRRGHQEEDNILAELVAAGLTIISTQAKVDFGSHVAGSADAVISGVPEARQKPHLAEFKTHSLASFKALEKEGVEKSKPMHFVQMQVYMLGLSLDRALYYAVCKDNDHIHTERVRLDKAVAEKAVARGRRLAIEERLPPPISTDPTWWQCKFCPAHRFCHQTHLTKEVNCRTCALVTPLPNGQLHCEKHKADIPVDWQRKGCPGHVLHPDLVPWKQTGGTEETATYLVDGVDVVNGGGATPSLELVRGHVA